MSINSYFPPPQQSGSNPFGPADPTPNFKLSAGLEAMRVKFNNVWHLNFTPAEFEKFMNNLEHMIASQMQHEQQQMQQASEKLKQAETGQDDGS